MMQRIMCDRAPWALLISFVIPVMMAESTSIPLRTDSCRGIRSYGVAMAGSGAYDFTTKATGTLRTQAAEEPPLYVPSVS